MAVEEASGAPGWRAGPWRGALQRGAGSVPGRGCPPGGRVGAGESAWLRVGADREGGGGAGRGRRAGRASPAE